MPKAKPTTEEKEVMKDEAVAESEVKAEKKPKKVSTSEKAKAAAASKDRDPLANRGKNYKKAIGLIDRDQRYELAEAIGLIKKTATTKFDSSVDIHVNLGIDPAQSDQMVRTGVVLPGGAAKTPKVKVVGSGAEGEKAIAD